MMPNSLIGRVGHWCFRHRWIVLAAWTAAVITGVLATGPLFNRLADSGVPRSVESLTANDVLSQGKESAGTILGVIDNVDPSKPEVQTAVAATAAQIAEMPGVDSTVDPFTSVSPTEAKALQSTDKRAVLVSIKLADLDRPDRDAAATAIAAKLRTLTDILPGSEVSVGGAPVLNMQNRAAVQQDLKSAEFTSLPVTLLVLILVFGGLIAAGLPVLAAVVSVAAAMAVMLGFSVFTDVDQDGVTVVTLLGLGLSIDYGLLLVARYREELLLGHLPEVAIARAWATAGRTILFSALTVAAALSGLLMFDLPTLTALGAAGVSIAVVAMLVSLTFAAALIGLLQSWIRPSKHRRRLDPTAPVRRSRRGRPVVQAPTPAPASTPARDADDVGVFAWLSGLVQRRALVVAVVTFAGLLAAGIPLLSTQIQLPGLSGVPRSIEAARVADTVANRFDGPSTPAITVVARTDKAALDVWAAQWQADPTVAKIHPAQVVTSAPDEPLSTVAIDVVGDRQGPAARDLVRDLRAHRPALQSWVTGDPAILTDLLGLIGDGLPLAIAVTLLAMLLLLFAMTGSLVVPLKAVVANLISLGATFGVMTAVFENGFASGPLHTITVGSLNPFVVVIIFAFAFGLSMDYEVFLLGRIKEYVDTGLDTETAVRRGLQHSGRVITSAALLMVIVFGCFAAARTGNVEQIGFGLAVAVFIDATIVRCLLVPATMTLLGKWNWWAPAILHRLHERIGLREHPLPQPPTEPPPPGRGARLAALTAGPTPLALAAGPASPSPAATVATTATFGSPGYAAYGGGSGFAAFGSPTTGTPSGSNSPFAAGTPDGTTALFPTSTGAPANPASPFGSGTPRGTGTPFGSGTPSGTGSAFGSEAGGSDVVGTSSSSSTGGTSWAFTRSWAGSPPPQGSWPTAGSAPAADSAPPTQESTTPAPDLWSAPSAADAHPTTDSWAFQPGPSSWSPRPPQDSRASSSPLERRTPTPPPPPEPAPTPPPAPAPAPSTADLWASQARPTPQDPWSPAPTTADAWGAVANPPPTPATPVDEPAPASASSWAEDAVWGAEPPGENPTEDEFGGSRPIRSRWVRLGRLGRPGPM